MRNHRYSQLVAEHECGYSPKPACHADFDGDGQFTQIKIQYRHDTPVELPPRFSGTEPEAVLNAFLMDNTLRTHVATARQSNRDRLLVFDGTQWPGKNGPTYAVYARNSNQLVETPATKVDKEILAAMAARDDAGTWNQWVAYGLLAWPVRLIYIVLFVIVALSLTRLSTRVVKST